MESKMNEKSEMATRVALKKELHSDIIKKLSTIRENILDEKGPAGNAYIQMLININDDCDDLLLNWETSELDLEKYKVPGQEDDEEDYDED
jgi:hypothetical protein